MNRCETVYRISAWPFGRRCETDASRKALVPGTSEWVQVCAPCGSYLDDEHARRWAAEAS